MTQKNTKQQALKEHMQHDKKRHKIACTTSDVTLPPYSRETSYVIASKFSKNGCVIRYTRSKSMMYDKRKCFSCQGKVEGVLHECHSENIGAQTHDIVQHSNKPEWKLNYANVISENDALSRDIDHKQCIIEQCQLLKHELAHLEIAYPHPRL